MHFSMTHHFDDSPEQLWDIFDRSDFEQRLGEMTDTKREILETRTDDGVEITRIRSVARRELPAVMKRALGIDRFQYEQEQRLDRRADTLEWTVQTPFLTDRVTARGTVRLESTDAGCTRIVEGEVHVQLPLVGKKMERKLAEKIRNSHEQAAGLAEQLLEKTS